MDSVFTRVTAEHKRILVEALQGNGHRVAITCHAAAEQLALQTADVGAALDKLSSDAAREAAGAVLYDDSFSTLVAAIRAGRVMTFHLSQALTFSLSCKLALLLLAAISLAINGSMSPLPVAPLHAVVLAALIDSMAATVFTHAPVNARALMHRPPKPLTFDGAFWRRVLLEATVCGCAGLAALESVLWIHALKGSVAVAQSVTFIALILAVVLMACAEQVSFHRSAVVEPSEWTGDRNALIGWTIGVSLIVLTLFESHVGYAFSVEPLSLAQCGCALGSPLLTVALYWIVKNSCRSAN
jgi:Ca2+-transporting ATPase